MSIQVLSSEVIDQIAAGEVVERPAHLVKELVENSIDAGASKIEIDFAEGGRRVRVTDNGFGMSATDLAKAFERHATSKISESNDLWKLKTFGFRGEALASIAAVSRIVATSRRSSDEQASRLHLNFGAIDPIEKISANIGTSISMTDLFENIPARRKFLKSDSAETNQIRLVVKALALAHPEIEFRWMEDSKLMGLWTAALSHKERMKQVLEINELYEGQFENQGIRVRAVMASPEVVSKTTKNVWLFAQNRWIQDRAIATACLEAYRNLLMHGEYPNCAIWIDIDPEMIDVNVHPTKSQVKFQEPSQIFRAVFHALRAELEKGPWLKRESTPMPAFFENSKPMDSTQQSWKSAEFEQVQYQQKSVTLGQLQSLAESRTDYKAASSLFEESKTNSDLSQKKSGPWSRLQVLGQAAQTYILCQSGEALVLVDQHAAHERVAFEKLMNTWKLGKACDIQEFLFPLSIDLSEAQIEALESQKSELQKLGIQWDLLAPQTLGITAAPTILKDAALVKSLDQLSHELVESGQSFVFEKYLTDLFATMACHSVVRAGQALSQHQMQELLEQMDEFPLSSYCPHGRPVSVEISFSKLEKDFGRKL